MTRSERFRRLARGWLGLVWLALTAAGTTAATAAEEATLAGTWKLVSFVNVVDGVRTEPFGAEPLGYFVYTEDGFLSIQILANPPPPSIDELDVDFRSNASYVGYFGRYTFEPERSRVIHHVEGGTALHYIGTDQVRPVRLEGDRLIIGVEGRWERVLERVGR